MSYAACDDVGASAVATQVVVGLGATVVLVVVGAAVVVGAVVAVVAVVVADVAWVVVIAEVELVTVLDADGEPPHALRTAANAARVRSALGRIVR
jgi:hypothetical protein